MKKVIANSQEYQIDSDTTLDQFLSSLKIQTKWVVVEKNGEPVARDQFTSTSLEDGDKLEIVTPIAGG